MGKETGLGRGLDALLDVTGDISSINDNIELGGSSTMQEIPLDLITTNPNQPRTEFDGEMMNELTSSIKQYGVCTAITVRKKDDNTYELIAGERRVRAARAAGLSVIPAFIKNVSESESAELALVENIQRADLNPIEVAMSYKNLMEMGHYTQEDLADKVGKKRATVTNALRLLGLPAPIQIALRDREITAGHAKVLLSLSDDPEQMLSTFQKTRSDGMSVRSLEDYVQRVKDEKKAQEEQESEQQQDPEGGENGEEQAQAQTVNPAEQYSELVSRLSSVFGKKVSINCNSKGAGKISIPFGSDDELSEVMMALDSMLNK